MTRLLTYFEKPKFWEAMKNDTSFKRSLGYDDDAVFNVWANSESDPSSLFRPEGRIDYKSMKSKILEAIMNDYDDTDCLSENNVF